MSAVPLISALAGRCKAINDLIFLLIMEKIKSETNVDIVFKSFEQETTEREGGIEGSPEGEV